MKYGNKLAAIPVVVLASAAAAQQGADFRMVNLPTGAAGAKPGQVGLVDAGSIKADGDVRSFTMYMHQSEPSFTARADVRINCRDRTESLAAIAKEKGDDAIFDTPVPINEPWGKADEDTTGAQIVNLVCAPAAERDRYASRLAANDWHSALEVALARKDEGKKQ
jgi:hypothetical protein